ncbi:TetR/AcrR family transcriptional regulator [Microscilla marina]|uniref:Transcriptional regulator, TetR family n=1 Tax=Microscilla marina ATCC 23134 TaxID=313606 RepID=A1ZK53_MICM2|nr:TetR/AcrR family transcriptional regulator [Microscilla marina]EAY29079.1 transcriptional regulator, TetR family [Microscilla marina ATCC 23134]
MGVLERKEREKKQRRNAILDAAEKIFFRQGLSNTSMDSIAKEAEFSKGTLYLYFKNKEELYRAVLLRGFILLEQRLKEETNEEENAYDSLKKITMAYYKFSQEEDGYFNAILSYQDDEFDLDNLEVESGKSVKAGNRVMQILIDALERGRNDGSIDPNINPVESAFVLWSQFTGFLQMIKKKKEIIDHYFTVGADHLLETYFLLLEKSLKP